MSHFTVLVIGENPEEQLAPFHEFECTGENDRYVKDIDQTEDDRNSYDNSEKDKPFADWVSDYHGRKKVFKESDIDIDGEHKYGYVLCAADGSVIKSVRRTNPNSHWDWYSLGGRWTGFFKTKEHVIDIVGSPGIMTKPAKKGHSDMCLKGEIDIDYMRNEAGLKAQNDYEFAETLIAGTDYETWESVRERVKNIDEARDIYHSQERVKRFNTREAQDILGHFIDISKFNVSKSAYIENARNAALCTFAIIRDGAWHERGKMGWWGMVRDEMDSSEWNEEFNKLIDSLPDDVLLSVYDCHI